jgi:ABC-2 type transport system permease protein
MYQLMIKQFLRNRIAIFSLALLLASGIISLLVGRSFVRSQQLAIEETTAHQEAHIKRLVKYESKEFGLLMYYMKFAYINPTAPMAGLSIGQRDINNSIQSLTIRNLEAQKYDTDIRNPYRLMNGNFDLSFVILYLFPLVIIALCYNLHSEEKEKGIWPLVRVHSKPYSYLLKKISIPFLFVTCVLFILFLLAIVLLPVKFSSHFLGYMVVNFLYVSFWFSVALLVISLFKSSNFNAISLLSAWLLLTILLPAAINNNITRAYPVPESFQAMLKQRDGYHTKWDIPKDSVMKLFFKEYPQYASYKWESESFDYFWYYAMQHLGDAEAQTDSRQFTKKLAQRSDYSRKFARFIPTVYTQLYSNELAQTDLNNHLQYLDSATQFHERLRHYFYPKIFTASPVLQEDWTRYKPVYCEIENKTPLKGAWYPGLFVLLLGAIGLWRLKRD